MKPSPWLDELLRVPAAKRWLTRKRLPRENAILPLTYSSSVEKGNRDHFLYSLDPRALRLTERLARRYTDLFPVDVLPSGFAGPTGVAGNFYGVLNVSGYGMDPLPIPISDNSSWVASEGLATQIRKGDEPYLRELVRLFFGAAVPANLHIRKGGSTSFPYFVRGDTPEGNRYKKHAALQALRNPDDFLTLGTSRQAGDLRLFADRYHAMYLFAIHERQQANAVELKDGEFRSKNRRAATERGAREGRHEDLIDADMSVHDLRTGALVPNHFAMRRRDVFGMNGVVNYFLSGIIGCFREVYLNRFAFTYKTRDRHDKERKIAQYAFTVGSDVKTMDKMIPRWFLEFVLSELHSYLDERVVEMMRRAYQAPYVVPQPWRKTPADYNPAFGDSPFSGKFEQHVGLPSGIAFNPDWGKLWMTFVYMILYRDCGAIVTPGDMEPLLRGQNRQHALLDMSDDAAFLTNSAAVAERLRSPKSPYAILEVETPVIFLGDVLCEVDGRRRAFPNPITYVQNIFAREDSIDSLADRPYDSVLAWAEGTLARQAVYASTPLFRDLNAIYEEECRKHLGVNPNQIAKSLAVRQRFNDIDAAVRSNPHLLHYKVDPKDVSPAVLDDLVATIPATDFFNHIRHLFKVPVTDVES